MISLDNQEQPTVSESRKFYRTVFTVEILSDEPFKYDVPEDGELCDDGIHSLQSGCGTLPEYTGLEGLCVAIEECVQNEANLIHRITKTEAGRISRYDFARELRDYGEEHEAWALQRNGKDMTEEQYEAWASDTYGNCCHH
jgi:hypothetical protein